VKNLEHQVLEYRNHFSLQKPEHLMTFQFLFKNAAIVENCLNQQKNCEAMLLLW
jgi:hypothetical protein